MPWFLTSPLRTILSNTSCYVLKKRTQLHSLVIDFSSDPFAFRNNIADVLVRLEELLRISSRVLQRLHDCLYGFTRVVRVLIGWCRCG